MIRVELDVDENGNPLGGVEDKPVDLFKNLMNIKHVVENGSFPRGNNRTSDDDESEDSLEENRYKLKYAMDKIDRVDKLVKDFTKACNKDDFIFSLINTRDHIVFTNLCRKDQKTFEACVLRIVKKQRNEYDAKVLDLEDRIRHFDLNKQIEDFRYREERKNNPLSVNASMGQFLDVPLTDKNVPTNIQELKELELIVDKGETPTLLSRVNIQNKLDLKLKADRKKVVKLLKIVSNISIMRPTLTSVNTDNMIAQRQPYMGSIESKLATEFHTSETSKWTNWSNTSFLWKKTLESLHI